MNYNTKLNCCQEVAAEIALDAVKKTFPKVFQITKRYGDRHIKITGLSGNPAFRRPRENAGARGEVNDEKLQSNLIRTKAKIFELAICNEWEHYITLTIDGAKFGRYDLKEYYKAFGYWLQNYNRKNRVKIVYLLIPEMHKDGAWHMHGLISGIPPAALRHFKHKFYNWIDYEEKFGFCSVERVRSKEGVSKYVTKYISKDMASRNIALNAKLYYCSKGLNRCVEVSRGFIVAANMTWDYEGEYAASLWVEIDEHGEIK